jgi:L-aspartate semialdehyde sulfurtransferase
MKRTFAEINQKIKEGKIQVVTKEELLCLVKEKGYKAAYKQVDVVTTATFGPMCSSGAYFNMGNVSPKIKFGGGKVTLDKVSCYAGFAAGDFFLGATSLKEDDPANSIYPGNFSCGGGHVIEKLVSKKDVLLKASAYGTDCYPRKDLTACLNINDLNEAVLFNVRNCYQNYNAAVNTSDKPVYTYMGILSPNLGNVNFCSAGFYSPLLCDPDYKVIGIGTRIFLGGAEGFVSWWGTQHNPSVKRTEKNVPKSPAGTMAVIGNLKDMSKDFLKGVSITGYGVSLSVGIGVPIPVLDEEIFKAVCIKDEDIVTQIVDYGHDYPKGIKKSLGQVNYKQLRSGSIELNKKKIPSGSLSSLRKAKDIAVILKKWIEKGKFNLTEKVESFPDSKSSYKFKPLKKY